MSDIEVLLWVVGIFAICWAITPFLIWLVSLGKMRPPPGTMRIWLGLFVVIAGLICLVFVLGRVFT